MHRGSPLQGLPFGHLGSLWSVLLAWGAPGAFAGDAALLRPAWTIMASCLEHVCSGACPTHRVGMHACVHPLQHAATLCV